MAFFSWVSDFFLSTDHAHFRLVLNSSQNYSHLMPIPGLLLATRSPAWVSGLHLLEQMDCSRQDGSHTYLPSYQLKPFSGVPSHLGIRPK